MPAFLREATEDLPENPGIARSTQIGRKQDGVAMVAANTGDKFAKLYTYQTLDGLVELVEAVSRDFHHHRLGRYRCLDHDVVVQLTSFDKVGIETNYPDKKTRSRHYEAYLGDQLSANAHPVLERAKSLRKSSARYVELTMSDPNSGAHCLDCVQLAAKRLLRVYIQLAMGTGSQFARAYSRTGSIFRLATDILREPSFAAAFGVTEIGEKDWPESEYSRRGGKLVRQIMAVCDSNGANDSGITDVGRRQLENLKAFQSCAFYGAKTIRILSEENWNRRSDYRLDVLAKSAARWEEAINNLPGKVDRYRFSEAYLAQITGSTTHMQIGFGSRDKDSKDLHDYYASLRR